MSISVKKKSKLRPTTLKQKKLEVSFKLLRWRRSENLSQSEAADAIGVKVRTYQNWEQGMRCPTGLSLTALNRFLRAPSVAAR